MKSCLFSEFGHRSSCSCVWHLAPARRIMSVHVRKGFLAPCEFGRIIAATKHRVVGRGAVLRCLGSVPGSHRGSRGGTVGLGWAPSPSMRLKQKGEGYRTRGPGLRPPLLQDKKSQCVAELAGGVGRFVFSFHEKRGALLCIVLGGAGMGSRRSRVGTVSATRKGAAKKARIARWRTGEGSGAVPEGGHRLRLRPAHAVG